MDIATLLGIISAFGLVVTAIFMGGGLMLFINIPSALIVIGGTIGTTLIAYPLGDMLKVVSVVKNALLTQAMHAATLIETFVNFANKSRREGILALEGEIKKVENEFLKKGIQLSIDGLEPTEIKDILETGYR